MAKVSEFTPAQKRFIDLMQDGAKIRHRASDASGVWFIGGGTANQQYGNRGTFHALCRRGVIRLFSGDEMNGVWGLAKPDESAEAPPCPK